MKYNLDIERIARELEFDVEDVIEVVEIFLETVNDSLSELKDGIDTNDMKKIFEAAHSIKGSSANLLLEDISVLAKEIEFAGRANKNIDYISKYNELCLLIDNIKK